MISHQNDGSILLQQKSLIDSIIKAAHLDDSKHKFTPADVNALPQDKTGLETYLAGHIRPDIAFAVHQCARYTFQPKAIHEQALKRIIRYLHATGDEGFLIQKPSLFDVDCYVDADFAGL